MKHIKHSQPHTPDTKAHSHATELHRLRSHKTPAEHIEHAHRAPKNSLHRVMTHIVAPVASLLIVAGVAVGAQVAGMQNENTARQNTTAQVEQSTLGQNGTGQTENDLGRSAPAVPANSVCRTYDDVNGLSSQDSRIGMTPNVDPGAWIMKFSGLPLNYLFGYDGYHEYNLSNVSSSTLRTTGAGFIYIKACAVNPGPAMLPFTSRWTMVDQQYVDFYGRHATAGEQAIWASTNNPNTILTWFVNGEAKQRGQLVRLYKAYYKRWPDASGYAFWVAKLKAGGDINDVSDYFSRSSEFKSTYGSLSNAQFVQLVYNNVMGRTPDSGGYAYWVDQLNQGKTTRGRMMLQFSESKEYRGKFGPDCDLVGVTLRMLRRAPSATELENWNPDMTANDLAYPILFQSSEYARRVHK